MIFFRLIYIPKTILMKDNSIKMIMLFESLDLEMLSSVLMHKSLDEVYPNYEIWISVPDHIYRFANYSTYEEMKDKPLHEYVEFDLEDLNYKMVGFKMLESYSCIYYKIQDLLEPMNKFVRNATDEDLNGYHSLMKVRNNILYYIINIGMQF